MSSIDDGLGDASGSHPRRRSSFASFAQCSTKGQPYALTIRSVGATAITAGASIKGPLLSVERERPAFSRRVFLVLENKVDLAALASTACLLPMISTAGAVSVRPTALVQLPTFA